MTKLVNLTPHGITVYHDNGNAFYLPQHGYPVRLAEERQTIGTIYTTDKAYGDGYDIPVNIVRYGITNDLPEPEDGTLYIVSRPVAEANRGRNDLIVPDDIVREDGVIIGCRAFATYSAMPYNPHHGGWQ